MLAKDARKLESRPEALLELAQAPPREVSTPQHSEGDPEAIGQLPSVRAMLTITQNPPVII